MTKSRSTVFLATVGTVLSVVLSSCGDNERHTVLDPGESSPVQAGVDPSQAVASGTLSEAVLVGAGNIARCDRSNDEGTAALLDDIPGTVFTLGNDAYPAGTAANFADCYGPSWGRHKGRTRPAPGKIEYKTANAAPYFDYFGTAAGEPGKGYYSYDLESWHIVVLNSEIDRSVGSPQEQWLRIDLAANVGSCTLAYWQDPLFWSGTGDSYDGSIKPLWDALYDAGAEVVINADSRFYERFAPQTPAGERDDAYGLREFVVGTGGYSVSHSFGTPLANSEARIQGIFGVLKLTLGESGYTWEFVPKAGSSATDSGSGSCHGAPGEPPISNRPPTADAGGAYSGTEGAAVQFDGSASSDPDGDALTYAWLFGDGDTGSGVLPSHTYRDNGSYPVTLTVTDAKGAESGAAASTASVANASPAVEAGPDATAGVGQNFVLSATFSDAGAGDTPWSHTIDWGDGSSPPSGSKNSQSDAITSSHVYSTAGSYVVRVTVTDKDGGQGSDDRTVTVTAAPPPPSPGAVVLVGAGDIADCSSSGDEATAALLDAIPGTVYTLGDNAYPLGRSEDYNGCYDPSWGRHKSRTYAALGNHEYDTGTAAATWDYFGDRAGPRDLGYYSFDIGEWHIVVLNSNCSAVGGCDKDTPQDQWLQADLAANQKTCTLAIWHHPRFWSGGNATGNGYKRFWRVLYDADAEIVLNGHRHFYERFAPQDKDGVADPARGLREFIVGTGGGEDLHGLGSTLPNSEVRNNVSHGVLKLTLSAQSYTWEFVPVAGDTFSDSGSGTCH